MIPARPLSKVEWVTLTLAFVGVVALGRSFSADRASAKTPTLRSGESNALAKAIVTLVGAEHMVRVDSRGGVVVYTVCDRSGNVLAANLSETDLANRFPALRLEDLHAADGTTLMLAEPRD